MHNDFYTTFDLERFPETTAQEGDYRTAFQIERDRIIFLTHSDAYNQDAGLSIGRIRLTAPA